MIATQRAVESVKASTWTEYMKLTVMERTTVGERPHCRLDLISLVDPNCRLDGETLTIVKDIPMPEELFPSQELISGFPHLAGMQFFQFPTKVVDIVIGVGEIQTFYPPLEIKRGLPNDPLGAKTGWGWACFGGIKNGKDVAGFLIRADNDTLSRKLERIWALDEMPGSGDGAVKMSEGERRVYDSMVSSVKFEILFDGGTCL